MTGPGNKSVFSAQPGLMVSACSDHFRLEAALRLPDLTVRKFCFWRSCPRWQLAGRGLRVVATPECGQPTSVCKNKLKIHATHPFLLRLPVSISPSHSCAGYPIRRIPGQCCPMGLPAMTAPPSRCPLNTLPSGRVPPCPLVPNSAR